MNNDSSSLYLIEKGSLVKWLFMGAMLLSVYGSMYTWFLLPIVPYYHFIAAILLIGAFAIDRSLEKSFFSRHDYLLPLAACILLQTYIAISNSSSLFGFLSIAFHTIIFMSLFRVGTPQLKELSDIVAKSLGTILIPSILFFMLYIMGWGLPSSDLVFQDNFYSFTNYYFFLIDDRQLFTILPRFQSVFFEPAFLGSLGVVVLMSQHGKWRKWYNIAILTGVLLSFSLGAYVYLFVVLFLNVWRKRKKFLRNLLITIAAITAFTIGVFNYNNGDNLIHDLIMLRLEVEDGELAGNNRVTDSFDADYENFVQSSDILFGRDKENEFGDSGYKVFFYENGLVGIVLLLCFYVIAFLPAKDRRSAMSAGMITFLIFIVDAFVLWYGRFIPLYCTAYCEDDLNTGPPSENDTNNDEQL